MGKRLGLDQCCLTLALLMFGPDSALSQGTAVLIVGYLVTSIFPSSNSSVMTTKISLDVATCALGGKVAHGLEPLD